MTAQHIFDLNNLSFDNIINHYQLNQTEPEYEQIQTHLNQSNQVHDAAMELAYNTIPEMIVETNMIYLYGHINDHPVKILLDTGAALCVIFESSIKRLNLLSMIDPKEKLDLIGIGKESSLGRIWYTELKLENNIYPISLIVTPNTHQNFDMILGINFLQLYGAQIDFKKRTIKLNDTYMISFNYINQ